MKKEYDFFKGEREKFYRPGVELNIPVYLEPDVAKVVRQRATRRCTISHGKQRAAASSSRSRPPESRAVGDAHSSAVR
jgi:hypothetical protein